FESESAALTSNDYWSSSRAAKSTRIDVGSPPRASAQKQPEQHILDCEREFRLVPDERQSWGSTSFARRGPAFRKRDSIPYADGLLGWRPSGAPRQPRDEGVLVQREAGHVE